MAHRVGILIIDTPNIKDAAITNSKLATKGVAGGLAELAGDGLLTAIQQRFGFAAGDALQGNDSSVTNLRFKVKVVSFSRDMTSAAGTQVVTVAGMTPYMVIFFANVSGATAACSLGMDDGTNAKSTFADAFGWQTDATSSIFVSTAGTPPIDQYAHITALASGSFTLTWGKHGAPVGTAVIHAAVIGW